MAHLKTYHISEDFEGYIQELYPNLKETTVLTEGVDFQTITVEKPFKVEQAIPLVQIKTDAPPPEVVQSATETVNTITQADIDKGAENFWRQYKTHHYGKAGFEEVKAYYVAGFKDALKRLNIEV